MPDDFRPAGSDPERLERFWDDLTRGEEPAPSALDPELTTAIRRFHRLAAAEGDPVPDPIFVHRLLGDLMHTTAPALADSSPLPLTSPFQSNGRIFPPLPLRLVSGDAAFGSRMLAQLATAAMVVLTLLGSFFAFGPARYGREQPQPAYMPMLASTPATPDPAAPVAELEWATEGGPGLPLLAPGYLALDPSGNLWIPDGGNDRFQIFAPDGTFLEAWGEPGAGDGQFEFELGGYSSASIAFAPDGSFYVVDTGNLRIQKFAPDRSFVTAWGGDGNGPGQFKFPNGIAVDAEGRVYVTDDGRHDVQVFDENGTDLANGVPVRTIGERGFKDGQFFFATGSAVAIDPAGNAVISDSSNQRLQTFAPDGTLLSVLPGGPGKEQLSRPGQVAVDAAGRLFVTAPDLRHVQVFASDGSFIASWGNEDGAAWANPNLGVEEFLTPTGIVLDGEGNVYVSDYERETVLKFRLLPPLAPASAVAPAAPVEFVAEIRGGADTPLLDPSYVNVDPDGNLWVADGRYSRYLIFAADGTFREAWGDAGSEDGQFNFRSRARGYGDVAWDEAGNFYVADTGNYRVQKFDRSRQFVAAWGSKGSDNVQFQEPQGIAIGHRGRVYVTDAMRDDVQVFDASGTFLVKFGGFGEGPGLVTDLRGGIAIAPDGDVLIADADGHRVHRFTRDGVFLTSWGGFGGDIGEFANPDSIAVDAQGRIYVTDNSNHRVQIFADDGEPLGTWGSEGFETGQFQRPAGIAIDTFGSIYVADTANQRIQKFRLQSLLASSAALNRAAAPQTEPEGLGEFIWSLNGGPSLPFHDPTALAFDPAGNLWVPDGRNNRFQIFTPDGEFLETWGKTGTGDGEFNLSLGAYGYGAVAWDQDGNIYVADSGNFRIQKFAADRTFLAAWGSRGNDDGQFLGLNNLTIDREGRIHATDHERDDIQVFALDGTWLGVWGGSGRELGQFDNPGSVIEDASGHFYVSEYMNHRVQKFSPDGRPLVAWGESGREPGQLSYPTDVAVDAAGRIMIADYGNHRIQVLDPDGGYFGAFGTLGLEDGQFVNPIFIALDGQGFIYVSDEGSDRVQKFRLLLPD